MNSKRYVISVLSITAIILTIFGSLIVNIDPFMYYKKQEGVHYYYDETWFFNPGLAKNANYDTVLLGNSMMQNTRASQVDELFDATTIKLTSSGASAHDVYDTFKLTKEKNVKTAITILDVNSSFTLDKEFNRVEDKMYLMDTNKFNDVNYLLNKNFLFERIQRHLKFNQKKYLSTPMDKYQKWDSEKIKYGKEEVMKFYISKKSDKYDFNNLKKMFDENVEFNFKKMIEENSNTQFNFIIPPRGIIFYKNAENMGYLDEIMYFYDMAISELSKFDNVEIYNFMNDIDIITNLDLYKDAGHYKSSVNDYMIENVSQNKHLIEKENYKKDLSVFYDFVKKYKIEK